MKAKGDPLDTLEVGSQWDAIHSGCGEIKNLVEDFYRTRKDRGPVASSYSYECKECTIKRIMNNKKCSNMWEYPDW